VFDWIKSEKGALWATFFIYFGGSLGWIFGKGESAFWSQEAISTLINPPFALSLVLILLGLTLLLKLEKKYTIMNFILGILIFGLLIEIKAYAGLLCLGGLAVIGIYTFIISRKTLFLKLFFGSLFVSLILYIPLNKNSVALLVFQPFWFLETLMGLNDRLNWTRFYSAMMTYRSGHIWLKAIATYFMAFIIFWVGNMGLRIVKEFTIWRWLKNFKKLSFMEVFIASIVVAGGLIPMLFLQKGTPWNTIQFFYYSLFFSGILAGISMTKIDNKFLIYAIILLTIPTTILTLKDVYIPPRPPAMLGINEINALSFLARQPDGIVLTRPFDEFASRMAENNPPRPLYLYTSTAYVSAFSKHQTFFEDEINLDITGYNWQQRKEQVINWYQEKDFGIARQFFVNNNIGYIYWIKSGQPPLDLSKLRLANIYENDLITIYKVE
jgi:hypothetical protein